jgi:hypothetical protein
MPFSTSDRDLPPLSTTTYPLLSHQLPGLEARLFESTLRPSSKEALSTSSKVGESTASFFGTFLPRPLLLEELKLSSQIVIFPGFFMA